MVAGRASGQLAVMCIVPVVLPTLMVVSKPVKKVILALRPLVHPVMSKLKLGVGNVKFGHYKK